MDVWKKGSETERSQNNRSVALFTHKHAVFLVHFRGHIKASKRDNISIKSIISVLLCLILAAYQ